MPLRNNTRTPWGNRKEIRKGGGKQDAEALRKAHDYIEAGGGAFEYKLK